MISIINELIIIGHVILSSVLAGVIGVEREISGKPAGLRTNMIVGGAAAMIVSIGKILIEDYSSESFIGDALRTDPLRVIEAVVVGVSFIGAGTILKVEDKSKVQYLTTAAVILFSAGIGMSVALQQYILAVGVTAFILLINVGANYIDRWISRKQNKKGGS